MGRENVPSREKGRIREREVNHIPLLVLPPCMLKCYGRPVGGGLSPSIVLCDPPRVEKMCSAVGGLYLFLRSASTLKPSHLTPPPRVSAQTTTSESVVKSSSEKESLGPSPSRIDTKVSLAPNTDSVIPPASTKLGLSLSEIGAKVSLDPM